MNLLEAMEIYVQVVQHGSFTKAAEANQLHRPAVTKAVQQLEKELGVQLLRRTTRRQSLTEEGEEFYQRSKLLLADVAEAMSMFSPSRPPQGRLRLDMPTAIAKSIVVPALPDFRRRYPDVELVIRSSDHQVDLVSEGVDCALRLGELGDSSLVARRIGSVPMVTCGSRAYLQEHGTPSTLDELDGHVAVNFFLQHSQRVLDWQFDVEDATVRMRLRSDVVVDNSETFLTCGLAGLGLLQGPRPMLQPFIDRGELIEVLPDVISTPKPISVVVTDRRHKPPKVDAFVRWLSELFVARGLS